MKNAIIVHGMPSKDDYYNSELPSMSNSHWVPWLQNMLLTSNIAAVTPEMPLAFAPDYAIWQREFERYDISEDTILVGHSCGGGFLVRWLSEHTDIQVGKVILVAPWIDPFREDTTDFFEFTIDKDLAARTKGLWIFNSDTDSKGVHSSVTTIRAGVSNVQYKEFHDYGHFVVNDMKTDVFPELLEVLLTDNFGQ